MPHPAVNLEDLLAYAAGETPGRDVARIEQHLAAHPEATRIVELYRAASRAMQQDDSIAPPAAVVERARSVFRKPSHAGTNWLERVEAIIARVVYDSRLQPAALRYTDTGSRFQLTYETEDLDVDLQAERTALSDDAAIAPETPRRWRLTGQVGAERELRDVMAALVPAGSTEPVAMARGDEQAMFTVDAGPGRYDLRIRVGEQVILLTGIELS